MEVKGREGRTRQRVKKRDREQEGKTDAKRKRKKLDRKSDVEYLRAMDVDSAHATAGRREVIYRMKGRKWRSRQEESIGRVNQEKD